jgi:short subunit fatty acids transporter
MDIFGVTIPDIWIIYLIIILGALIVVLLIIWAIRHSQTKVRKLEIEVERQKLDILAKDLDAKAKVHPFTRLSTEQIQTIRVVEDENNLLELNNYAKEKMVEIRLLKLENLIRQAKLDRMLIKLDVEEKKVK